MDIIQIADMFQIDELFEHLMNQYEDFVTVKNVWSFYVAADR